ncbi:hypothetical protein RIF29_22543 [Crotalaria pallida]|uniref:non-specific serine/threonine protein kinase n=1 Tax=Crotalaria pallida TaxID=3830 RepID=A0AAN9F4S4_CROPI
MNQKNLLSILNSNYIILFSFLTTTTLCYIEPKFEACEPKTCGNNQSISYPFYIEGTQEPFCGYPGFALSCSNNGYPILNLSNSFYIIDQISYDNQSLRVSNVVFSRSRTTNNKGCLPLIQNLTLPSSNKFVVAPNQKDVLLFYGCDLSSLGLEAEHRIGCYEENNNETSSVVALYKEDNKNVGLVSRNCKGGVVDLMVEDDVKGNNNTSNNIEEALRKGFLLNWIASDCKLCKSSGGRCGFDSSIFNFRCYCTDRIHAWKCDPPPPG